jgi:hypothetical protein
VVPHQAVGHHPHAHEPLQIAHDLPKDLLVPPLKDLSLIHDTGYAMIK